MTNIGVDLMMQLSPTISGKYLVARVADPDSWIWIRIRVKSWIWTPIEEKNSGALEAQS